MKSWDELPLGELCDIAIGRTPPRSERSYWGTGSPWLSIADMNDGRYISGTKEQVTEDAAAGPAGRLVEAGTLVLSFKLSVGKVAVTQVPMYTNEAIASLPIRDVSRADKGFLYWVLRCANLLRDADDAAMGKNLNKKKLAGFPVPLPPLVEQRRIAAVLDQVDDLRAKRRESIALLDDLAQSVFLQKFCTNAGVSHARLGDHLTFITSGGRGWAKYYANTGSRFIRSLDVRMNEILAVQPTFVQAPSNAEARRTRVREGDVLLTITGSLIGRVAPVPPELDGSYISQHVAILRTDANALRPDFLSYFMSLPTGGQQQIAQMQYGQTKPGLNFKQISEFHVPLPDLSEQDEFIECAQRISQLRKQHLAHLAALDELFTSLQQRAFNGTLWQDQAA